MDQWQNLKQTSSKFELHHQMVMQCSLSLTPRPVKTPPKPLRLKGWGLFPTLRSPGPEAIDASAEGGAIASMAGEQNLKGLHHWCGDRPRRQQQAGLALKRLPFSPEHSDL